MINRIKLGEPSKCIQLVTSQRSKESANKSPGKIPDTDIVSGLGTSIPNSYGIEFNALRGGFQEDVKYIDINNGTLTTRVVTDLGSSIVDATLNNKTGDGWKFRGGEVVGPHFLNHTDNNGLGWIRNFGPFAGNLIGGVHAGPASIVKTPNNTGAIVETLYPLHGYLGAIPASEVTISFYQDPTPAIVLISIHKEGFHEFGPYLKHKIKFTFPLNENRFQVEHRITNMSSEPREVMQMYHLNQIAEAGARIYAPIAEIRARDSSSEVEKWRNGVYTVDSLTPGHAEEVSYALLNRDENGRTISVMVSADKKSAVSISYGKDLPHTTYWIAPGLNGYAVEPGLNHSVNRKKLMQGGNELGISPILVLSRASLASTFEVGLHEGKNVLKAIQEVVDLMGGVSSVVNPSPLFRDDEAR